MDAANRSAAQMQTRREDAFGSTLELRWSIDPAARQIESAVGGLVSPDPPRNPHHTDVGSIPDSKINGFL